MPLKIPEDQYVKVSGFNTRFWSMGEKGPFVILIHGIGGYIELWENNIHALSQNYRVYALDLVGFGRSDKPKGPYSFSFLSQFVLDFMEALHIEKTSLIGNSMGGGISLQIVIRSPDKVEKLVLANTAGLGQEMTCLFRLISLPLIGELLSRPSRRGVRKIMKESVYDPSLVTEDFVECGYQLAALPGAQKAFLSTLRSGAGILGLKKMVFEFFLDNLSKITAPTLVVWGKQDRILPEAHAHVAKKRMANAQLHIFDPCGHLPQIERPEEFNDLVLDFLKG